MIALKRMKAEGQFIPLKQKLKALEAEAAALQASLEAAPLPHDGADLRAENRHTQYVVQQLQAVLQHKQVLESDLDQARLELRRALASQAVQDGLK